MSWRLLCIIILLHMANACTVSMQSLWSCVLEEYDYSNRGCVSAKQLYGALKTKTSTFTRAVIIAVEGPKYKRLFRSCDLNHDSCLSVSEMKSCHRSCLWKQTAQSLLCKK